MFKYKYSISLSKMIIAIIEKINTALCEIMNNIESQITEDN